MNRRDFSATATVAGLGLAGSGFSLPALAQAKPVEGKDYVRLAQPQPVPPGKIEVIEFFWYGCPHCNAFEPTVEAWVKKLSADVSFRRVPVAFRDEPFVAHQKIYYALEGLDLVAAMHRKVFYAIHNDRMRLDKIEDIAAFMAKNGVDAPNSPRCSIPSRSRPRRIRRASWPRPTGSTACRRWESTAAISLPAHWPRPTARWRSPTT